MEVFFLHLSEGARMPGKLMTQECAPEWRALSGCGPQPGLREDRTAAAGSSNTNSSWALFSHLARRVLSFGVYLVRNLQCCFIREEIWSQTCFSQCWASTLSNSPLSSHELITVPAHAFHTQCEFLFLIRRKAPIVECVIRFRGS